MASITIQAGQKNLIFAALVANSTGASFTERGEAVIILGEPVLIIPRYCFDEAFNPTYDREDHDALEDVWRSLIVNKVGHLAYFGDDEILLTDEPGQRPDGWVRFDRTEFGRPPERDEWYLVARQGSPYAVRGFWNGQQFIEAAATNNALSDVTHWRRLPAPPDGGVS